MDVSHILKELLTYPPHDVSMELTYRCVCACMYCHNPPSQRVTAMAKTGVLSHRSIDKRKWREMSTSESKTVIDDVAELGSQLLTFTGGEPLLRQDLDKLIQHAVSCGLEVYVLSNGPPVSQKRLADLKRSGLSTLQLNLSAHLPQDLSAKRGILNLLNRRIRFLRKMTAMGFAVDVNIVLIRQLADHLECFLDKALEAGARKLRISELVPYGHAFFNLARLVPSEEQVNRAQSLSKTFGVRLTLADKSLFRLQKPHPNFWGFAGLVITPNGYIFPSEEASYLGKMASLGHVKKDRLSDAWFSSPLLNKMRNLQWLKEPCSSCENKEGCRGGSRFIAYLMHRNLWAPDPTCPKVIRFRQKALTRWVPLR